MGLFGKRKSREERGLEIANKVASGKGFYGRATRAFVGSDDFAKIQQSVGALNSGLEVQALLATGAPTTSALVVSIADTGRLVNHDPVVTLVVLPAGGSDNLTLEAIVSKVQIPRAGDQVRLVEDTRLPGTYLYAGMF
ncbi:hypothetical protein F0L68_16030 [Solihabitans fulvus]|uniref:Uncharacterized protein n=1 Tax=Solihabitans fulvus TaxID=1892852 RepID=A0A5B2XEC2_9PSEU|nr:hypothetical protein [Solihabitans fulvus]KAA2261586.1 hypothetical protein F0L68_16030 [Solihabitans fulvus]